MFAGESWGAQFGWYDGMSSYGADLTFTDKLIKGEIKANNPAFINGLQKCRTLIEKGYIDPNCFGIKIDQAVDMLAQQKTAMLFTGTWHFDQGLKLRVGEKMVDYSFMPVPYNESGEAIPNFFANGYTAISAKCKNPDAAKKLADWMFNKDNVSALSSANFSVPPLKDSTVTDPIVKKFAPVIANPKALLYWPHSLPDVDLDTKLEADAVRFLSGAQSLDATLQQMQKDLDDYKAKATANQ